MTTIIETKNLTKTYGTATVVDKLNLAVTQGSVHGLLGPNGSGKSTTMKMMLGLLRPTAGEIFVLGQPMNRQTRGQVLAQVGSLIEQPSAYLHLTGAENLRIAARLLRAEPANVERAIELVRLEKHMDKLVKDYSLGMKQRLGIALALLRDPKILILDEPTNGLDPAGIEEIRELIVSLARDEGRTVLVSSHLLSEIEKMATELSIIHQGQLVFQGTQRELFETKLPDVFVETTAAAEAARVLQALQPVLVPGGVVLGNLSEQDVSDMCVRLVQQGVPITQVVRQHRSLEEVFIGLTGREGLQ
ncbi:ABC transporter ATP-binding protein [Corynebacterium sp. H128]|uniref:ABC transporter ATP-binding protein n=1 Tax=unclassified Corynebacterium TaxID=2624378 RepID=UPI0030AE4FDF